jgi:hypothetical protein
MNIELYTLDLCALLKEKARQAKADSQAASSENKEYLLGRLMAFHEIISLMQQQAEVFGIPLAQLGLHDIDPERDLL